MEIRIRDVPPDLVAKLDQEAREQNISRATLALQILEMSKLNTSERNRLYMLREIHQKILMRLESIDKLTAMLVEEMGGK